MYVRIDALSKVFLNLEVRSVFYENVVLTFSKSSQGLAAYQGMYKNIRIEETIRFLIFE